MVITLIKKPLHINFVVRHRFEKKNDVMNRFEWHRWEIGIWFKHYEAMSAKWKAKNSYMIGMNMLIVKFWLDITSAQTLILEIKSDESV